MIERPTKKLIDLSDLQDAVVAPTILENTLKESLGRAGAESTLVKGKKR